MTSAPLRVVIADDSGIYRSLLERAMASLGDVEVVAHARNGEEALTALRSHAPDVLTLDLNMPVLDGLATLRAIGAARLSCEVIVVSSVTKKGAAETLQALALGAVDFITKPDRPDSGENKELLTRELQRQLAAVRLRREWREKARRDGPAAPTSPSGPRPLVAPAGSGHQLAPQVLAVGASTGGPTALPVLLGGFPASFPLPILIAQHMPPLFTASLAESLTKKSALRVVEGRDGQLVKPGVAYIAPGGRHLRVKKAFDGSIRLAVSDDPPVNHCRPAVDVLLDSVAEVFGGRALVAILTGMGNDGARGVEKLKRLGAGTFAQDEASCTVFGMPREAIETGAIDKVLPLDRMAAALIDAARLGRLANAL